MEFNTGLNTTEIELNFNNDKIIMFLGGNGSGKSTIISQLHPFKESFDERKSLIIDGEEGRKEIDIENGNNLYEIVHIYSKTAQSFIKKDGVELNENGGVRTFEDIVSKELGLSKDYFNIGKIGSNTRSFVDFTTAERKAYIGKFLNIEEIMEKHKIAAAKLKVLKKDMAAIATELGKYKDKDVIETEISQLSKSTEEIDSELSELYTRQGALTTDVKRDTDDIGTASKEDLEQKIREKTFDSESNKKIKTELEAELDHAETAEDYKNELSEEIIKIQSEIQVNDSEKNNKNILLTDYNNKISATQIELNSLGNPEDMAHIISEIETYSTEMGKLRESIRANPMGPVINSIMKSKRDVNKDINKFVDFTDFIEKYFTNLAATDITNTKSNITYFFEEDFEESFKRQISESRKAIDAKKKLLESQQKDRGISEGYVCQLKNLEKRPHECNIDDCPFIKDAYAHRNVLSEIAEKDKEIKQTKADLETLDIKAENLQNLQNLYQNFLTVYIGVSPRDNQIYIEFLKEKSLIEWVGGSLADFQLKRQSIIDNSNNALSDFNKFIECKHKLANLENSRKILEDSDSTVKEKYERDILEYKEKVESISTELEKLISNGKILSEKLIEKQNLLEKYSTLIQATSKYTSAYTMLSQAKTEYEKISKLIDARAEKTVELNDVVSKISNLVRIKSLKAENLTNLKAMLARVGELNEKKARLDKEYFPVSTVEEALSPTKGIPLILMKTYLDETESIANELLDIAFGGEFQIKFVTTEKEFSIQVESKGNIKPDIKMASQGEMAITTISLSLALIEQSIGNYNILCLDEIDGPLDSTNRTNFIDILNSQIDKLGIEQVFVISHNNAFDTAEMGLILLRENNIDKDNTIFMQNKNIIYEYKE